MKKTDDYILLFSFKCFKDLIDINKIITKDKNNKISMTKSINGEMLISGQKNNNLKI